MKDVTREELSFLYERTMSKDKKDKLPRKMALRLIMFVSIISIISIFLFNN